jgi:beta-mannosidase
MMVEANLNSMRIHAHLERPEFYDAADEQGLLIWQDFPLQWGYTDLPAFQQEALRQVGDMVERYGDHPSIIVWCMHNESPHAMDWMQKRDPKQNLDLDNKLVELAAKLDPSRVAHRDSGTGDGHTYPGWYGGTAADFATQKMSSPFMTEYGAQALPNLDTLQQIFDRNVLFPQSSGDFEVWKYANFQPKETFEDAGIQKGKSIEEFIRNSQLYQAQVVRFGTENFRRNKYAKSTGIYHFMFVEDWPSITWAVVDYFRRPKLGYTALKTAMQPLLPSIDYRIDNPQAPVSLWVVNDTYRELKNAQLCWTVGTADRKCQAVEIRPDSVAKIVELGPMPEVAAGGQRLDVWIMDGDQVVSRNALSADDFIMRQSHAVTATN